MVTTGAGQPPELAIRADIEVPELKLALTWPLRRNTDKRLPATHVGGHHVQANRQFSRWRHFPCPRGSDEAGGQTRGPARWARGQVTPGFYLIGLSNLAADKERNLQLLMERGWFDIPVVYNNNRRAILAMKKGSPGERAFADAFQAWKE